MEDQDKIRSYVDKFRGKFSPHLKPGVGMTCTIYPSTQSGAILEFSLGPDQPNVDNFMPSGTTVTASLQQIDQRGFSGNLSGVTFAGTNTILEPPNRIILIKGGDGPDDWGEEATEVDVNRILQGFPNRS
jgi:hypothetical protein